MFLEEDAGSGSATNAIRNCHRLVNTLDLISISSNKNWIGGNRTRPYTPPPTPPPVTSGPLSPGYDDSNWEIVSAPHDSIINNTHDPENPWSGRSHLTRTNAYYRKHFRLPDSAKGKAAWLYFEGIFRVWKAFTALADK